MGEELGRRDRKRAERLVDRAVIALCEAGGILEDGGYPQPGRMLNNAAFEAATAISLARPESAPNKKDQA